MGKSKHTYIEHVSLLLRVHFPEQVMCPLLTSNWDGNVWDYTHLMSNIDSQDIDFQDSIERKY